MGSVGADGSRLGDHHALHEIAFFPKHARPVVKGPNLAGEALDIVLERFDPRLGRGREVGRRRIDVHDGRHGRAVRRYLERLFHQAFWQVLKHQDLLADRGVDVGFPAHDSTVRVDGCGGNM